MDKEVEQDSSPDLPAEDEITIERSTSSTAEREGRRESQTENRVLDQQDSWLGHGGGFAGWQDELSLTSSTSQPSYNSNSSGNSGTTGHRAGYPILLLLPMAGVMISDPKHKR